MVKTCFFFRQPKLSWKIIRFPSTTISFHEWMMSSQRDTLPNSVPCWGWVGMPIDSACTRAGTTEQPSRWQCHVSVHVSVQVGDPFRRPSCSHTMLIRPDTRPRPWFASVRGRAYFRPNLSGQVTTMLYAKRKGNNVLPISMRHIVLLPSSWWPISNSSLKKVLYTPWG